jgi:hypothetical protein
MPKLIVCKKGGRLSGSDVNSENSELGKKRRHSSDSHTRSGSSPFQALSDVSLTGAQKALDEGDASGALEWLHGVPEDSRPRELAANIYYQISKDRMARSEWLDAEKSLTLAATNRSTPLYQERIALLRRRVPLLDNQQWETLLKSIDPVERLRRKAFSPLITETWACGAYYSRKGGSWSTLLRLAKNPSSDGEEHRAAVRLASGFMCRFILERTDLLSKVDVVVPIPANPGRYSARMMSLPVKLAEAVEKQLGVPVVFSALTYKASADLELRGLNWQERYQAVRGSIGTDGLGLGKDRTILIIDDVITSGATMSEAARILRATGASDIYCLAMAHTEG